MEGKQVVDAINYGISKKFTCICIFKHCFWPLLKIYGSCLVNLCLGSICDFLTFLPHVAFLTKESKIHILNLYLHSVAIYVVAFLPYLYKKKLSCVVNFVSKNAKYFI